MQRGCPRRVVFVCYGNICRSPYAAEFSRKRLTAVGVRELIVESAGFIGPGRPANERGAAIAMNRGVDLSEHRSTLITKARLEKADLILVMSRRQRSKLVEQFGVPEDRVELLGDFDSHDPPHREIIDPYGKPDTDFIAVFEQIERSIEVLCGIWGGPELAN